MRDLSRLLRPRSIAVVGGGAWGRSVIAQCQRMSFAGEIWPVHPTADHVGGLAAVRDIAALPAAPDATFIGVNRHATVSIVADLAARGAGGAVCFASGFREAAGEDGDAGALQEALCRAAGEMPILGPNCYGFINYLDGALLWPDQHGGLSSERGVAIVTQSSNIAINLTMQKRGLPIAYVVTVGNQAQTGLSEIGSALLSDPRVTALGLHIEGVGDLRAFERLAEVARVQGKRIVALKVGASDQARVAAVSHTASLAGGDVGARALLARLGMVQAEDLATFLETLKLLHVFGPLPSNRIATLSCSGGEASLAADIGLSAGVTFPPLTERQATGLRAALGPMVALANPLDYHTYVWRDVPVMAQCFAAMVDPDLALILLVVDFPRADRCDPVDWDCTVAALTLVKRQTGGRLGLVSSLPETLPEDIAARLMAEGIVPLCGLTEALRACALASQPPVSPVAPLCLPGPVTAATLVPEAVAKATLARHGLRIPRAERCDLAGVLDCATQVGLPVVVKGEGVAHKTEAGAVALNLSTPEEALAAAQKMPSDQFLIEEMVTGAVVEMLIGVQKDPAHGFVMTFAAGGTWTEILADSASVLLPASDDDIATALSSLRIAKVLDGYRGALAINRDALLAAIRAVESYVLEQADAVEEVEINPLLCTPHDAIAADALLRRKDPVP